MCIISAILTALVWTPKAAGMEGPVMSASRTPTFLPMRRMATAREEVLSLIHIFHLWRSNTLLSIFGGTILYMVLVQAVFP